MSEAEVEDMYHVMAIANYEDRFVIPTTHREYAENTFNVRGGCGFSFGNGCSEGAGETSLFGSEKKRTIPSRRRSDHEISEEPMSLHAARAGAAAELPRRRAARAPGRDAPGAATPKRALRQPGWPNSMR